ncbi:hypothetical protein MRB53_032840 [Persea americana]|uniref:Uncharacterized protein n=1 Tax=Persea americana TaxID=3435 RepID=A0ACC2KTB5_PERAE|nr:hypothetical protein MRB53_032840 [Persea americana]
MASMPSQGWEPAIEDGPEIDGDLLMALLEQLGHSIMKIMNIGWIMYWEPLDWMMAKAVIHSTGLIWIWLLTLTVLTWTIGHCSGDDGISDHLSVVFSVSSLISANRVLPGARPRWGPKPSSPLSLQPQRDGSLYSGLL